MPKEFQLDHNSGHHEEDAEQETEDQLQVAYKRLGDLTQGDASMATLTKQDMSLMKQILTAASEEYKEQIMWRMCDFVDEDEALDHVAAYYEAKELGMDTGFNVAFMYALVSANRKTAKTNLMSQILDSMQHAKWAPGANKGKSNGNSNPRSPIG